MNIIITGASGFVGKNLQEYLSDDKHEIKALSLRNGNWQNDIKEGDVVLHLAGKAHDVTNKFISEEYFKVNRDLTIELFDLFLQSDIRDFFYFSSVKAAGDSVEGVLIEDTECNPYTFYGKSKLEAEQYLLRQTLPKGKRLFIIRPCMIHGRGNKGNLNLLYKIVDKGIPWPLANFKNQRSFLSIDNLCYLIDKMIQQRNLQSGVYHFADDETISTNELIYIISKALGKEPKFWNIPSGFIKSMVKIGDVLPLPLNSERLKKLTESYVVSNQKIKTALGIQKLPLSIKEGLIKTITSFNNHDTFF